MALEIINRRRFNWRWGSAISLFLLAFLGLQSGVGLTERPGVESADIMTKIYYSLGLFVMGGLDIGTPIGGPLLGRMALWVAYLGAPFLTATALVTAIIEAVAPHKWRLKRLHDHVVIDGDGELTTLYLRRLRQHNATRPVVVIQREPNSWREQELEHRYNATVLRGELSQSYLQRQLNLGRAKRVLLFGDDDFETYETAARILERHPNLEQSVVIRSHNLRFMRAMSEAAITQRCAVFNVYQQAAASLVHSYLIDHFVKTDHLDTVVMAGFGRFGQTIVEELEHHAGDKLERIAVIDRDANRRMLVVEEQQRLRHDIERRVFQGDISHPQVWQQLAASVDLEQHEPTIILGTGEEKDNLRTALWLKARYPKAKVYARTAARSTFAEQVGRENDIQAISIFELIQLNLPDSWLT